MPLDKEAWAIQACQSATWMKAHMDTEARRKYSTLNLACEASIRVSIVMGFCLNCPNAEDRMTDPFNTGTGGMLAKMPCIELGVGEGLPELWKRKAG